MIKLGDERIKGAYSGRSKIKQIYFNGQSFVKTAPSNCFFDKVSRAFFENKGSGLFVYGADEGGAYLQSGGTQYIDTGLLACQNTKVEIEYLHGAIGSVVNYLIGGFLAANTRFGLHLQNNYFGYQFYSASNLMAISSPLNQKNAASLSSAGAFLNGARAASVPAGEFLNERSMYIFAGNENNLPSYGFSGRIYSLKIWQNGVLAADFTPVKQGEAVY